MLIFHVDNVDGNDNEKEIKVDGLTGNMMAIKG